jgi:hypothetical protein
MSQRLLKGISLLLGALTSCDSGTDDTWRDTCPEYGCNDVCTVWGQVVDASTHAPIAGIRVGAVTGDGGDTRGIITTDELGLFRTKVTGCCSRPTMLFSDIDGDEDGVCYQSAMVEAELEVVGPGGPCYSGDKKEGKVIAKLEGQPAPCEVAEDTGWWW